MVQELVDSGSLDSCSSGSDLESAAAQLAEIEHAVPAVEVYERPELLSCSKNFNVMITDGQPTEDTDTPNLLSQLPDYSATLSGRTGCTGSGNGACLDDVAEYLSLVDIHPTLNGRQSVITHTIGFALDIDVLRDAANDSGGTYYLAEDSEELTRALMRIVEALATRCRSQVEV